MPSGGGATPRIPAPQVEAALGLSGLTFVGAGANGDVWRDHSTGCAIKIIVDPAYPPGRVVREVRALSSVQSNHVVGLRDAREVDIEGTVRAVLITDFVEGQDLQRTLDDGSTISVTDAKPLLVALLTGVADLHTAGVIHRDLKPANITLRDANAHDPVILDLGLARASDDSTLTVHGQHLGTPLYMAPEQLLAQRAKKAADLFAVGCTVRHLVTGTHPFHHPLAAWFDYDEARRRIEAGPAPLPDGLPAAVAVTLDRLVRYQPDERGSARSALRRLAREEDANA